METSSGALKSNPRQADGQEQLTCLGKESGDSAVEHLDCVLVSSCLKNRKIRTVYTCTSTRNKLYVRSLQGRRSSDNIVC